MMKEKPFFSSAKISPRLDVLVIIYLFIYLFIVLGDFSPPPPTESQCILILPLGLIQVCAPHRWASRLSWSDPHGSVNWSLVQLVSDSGLGWV